MENESSSASSRSLHPYQIEAVEFIARQKCCALFLDLGLGKTIISLTAIYEQYLNLRIRNALVIAPLRVANNVWRQEAEAWQVPLKVRIATGNSRERYKALMDDAQVHVINRENIPWLIENSGVKWKWDCVIIDESSSFKNHQARRFRALKRVIHFPKIVVLLTGTPVPNGLMDIWSQIFLLDQGERLGKTITAFRQRYYRQGYMKWDWQLLENSEESIHAKIGDIVMRMSSGDYLQLPERIDIVEKIELPEDAAEHYAKLEKDFVLELEKDVIDVVSAAVLANKLLQLCNGFLYTEDGDIVGLHEAKLDALEELIEEHPEENFLIAYNYKADLRMLKERFPSAHVMSDGAIEAWNTGKIRLLLAHPASAGHGLNLQFGGSTVVWYSMVWALELYEQFIGRLHRQGQTKPVRNIRIVARGRMDENVCDALAGKAKTQQDLFEYLKKVRNS